MPPTCRVTGLDLITNLLGAFRECRGFWRVSPDGGAPDLKRLLAGRRLAKGESGLRATASTISPGGVALNRCCGLASSGSTGREWVKETQGVITSLEESEC